MARASTKTARVLPGRDADEEEAVAAAAAVLQSFARVENPEAVAYSVITTWIIERVKRSAGRRIGESIVFDLDNAHIKGLVAGVLPKIADGLDDRDFPFGKTFSELSRDEAALLFSVGCIAYREAAVAAGEDPNFPFNDPIPFGDAA